VKGTPALLPARPAWPALIIVALVPALALSAPDAAQKGLDIARAADRANDGFSAEKATVTMELINAHGDVTRRKLILESLEGKDDGDKSKVTFEWPADVKGTKLLTWTHRSRDDDQWLYLPAIKRVRRIGGSNKTGSFMGSEFAYEDLASTEVEKYTYKYVDEPRVGARDTYRLERVPVDRDSGYLREVVWLDKEFQNPLRVEYYDRRGALLKVASFAGYTRYARLWRASSVVMENVQTKKRSVLTFEKRQLRAALAPHDFDSARLED
jgi:hypothetical protein